MKKALQLLVEIETEKTTPSENSFNIILDISEKISERYITSEKALLKDAHFYGAQFELLSKWQNLKSIFLKKSNLNSIGDSPELALVVLENLADAAAKRNFNFLKRRTNFYLDPKALFVEVLKSKRQEKLTNDALMMFLKLAYEVVDRMPYSDPFLKEEAEAGARLDLFMYWNRFNELKSINCFAYMTEVAKMGAAKSFNKSYKYGKKFKGKIISIDGSKYNDDSDGIYTL